MASRTQLRLSQLTGSIGTASGQINDQVTAAAVATGSIDSADLSLVISHLAAGIKKIHGGLSFSQANAGEFSHTIKPADDDGAALGTASKNWSDLFIADEGVINLGDDQDVKLTHVPDTGILLNSSRQLQFNDNGTFIHSDADGKLKFSADGTASDAINIDSSGGVDIDAADAINLTTTSADGDITLASAHTGGVAVYISGSAAATSIVDIDAGILQIDAEGVGHIQTGGQLDIATANSVAVNIGNGTSTVTIGDNLVVAGDLTVSGDTTTVSTTNLLVEDSLIGLQSELTGVNNNDIGFIFERGSTGDNAAFIWDESADRFTLGTTTATPDATGNLTITAGTLAATATNVTVSDDTTNAERDIVFTDGSNGLLEDDGAFTYNPSTGNATIPKVTVDDIVLDGKVITMTGDTSDTFTITAAANGETTLATVDDAGLAGHLNLNIDGNIILNAGSGINLESDIGGQVKIITGSSELMIIDRLVPGMGQPNFAVLSSSAGQDLALSSNSGTVVLGDGSAFLNNSLQVKLNDSDVDQGAIFMGSGNEEMLTLSASFAHTISGSLTIDGGDDPGALFFKEGGNGSNKIEINVPASVGGDFGITLPAAIGSAGQFLKINAINTGGPTDKAELIFADANEKLERSAYKVTATIPSSGDLNFASSGDVSLLSAASSGAVNIDRTSQELNKALEVFVNGQLLVSGTQGQTDTDYTFKGATTLRFSFDLEPDDIIQIIQR